MPAPIALFVYNRPDHTKRTLDALCKNELADKSEIFIFSDGPKEESDIEKISSVRGLIESLKTFKKINLIKRSENIGLAKSVVQGVNQVLDYYEEIIVLEDDIITSPYFLFNVNTALEKYRDEEIISAISGYTFPHNVKLPDLFCLFFPAVWGWATWKRCWEFFEENGQKLIDSLKEKNLCNKLNHNNSYPYTIMLEDEVKGIVDSWGIKWYASCVLYEKFTLMFDESLTKNIGHDNSGVHSGATNVHDVVLSKSKINFELKDVKENNEAQKQLEKYLHEVLYDSFLKMADVCSERLKLINSLNDTAEKRLNIINEMSEEIKRLKRII
jgi:hypothetical protein